MKKNRHRQENLDLYCGKPSHKAKNCLNKLKIFKAQSMTLTLGLAKLKNKNI